VIDHLECEVEYGGVQPDAPVSLCPEVVASGPLARRIAAWLGPRDVAVVMGVHYQTVYRWLRTDRIPYSRTPGGRYRVPLEWVQEQAVVQHNG